MTKLVLSKLVVGCIAIAMAALPGCSPPRTSELRLTAEGKAYVHYLQLSDVHMQASESYAKQTLTEIEGNVRNVGNRAVERVDVTSLFYDVRGIMILRERATLVKKPLKPGESRRFRLAFDDIPESWNNGMPQLVIAQVVFG